MWARAAGWGIGMLTALTRWADVAALADDMRGDLRRDLFAAEPDRLDRFRVDAAGLSIDLSKQRLPKPGLTALQHVLDERGFAGKRHDLLTGAIVNATEQRAALHTAARGGGLSQEARDAAAHLRGQARAFANAVRSGERTGARRRPLRTIVHIGIGGSDLGPRLVWEALKHEREPGVDVRFVANVDPADINDALSGIDPDGTLVVVASKSFTTQETRLNAEAARAWLRESLDEGEASQHIAAVTARPDRARAFGVAEDAIFAFDEGVGGRYSLWSSVSLAVEIGLQEGGFDALLAGGAAKDAHFAEAALLANAPVLLACVDVWNRACLGLAGRAVVPYAKRLNLLPFYLQQLEMESNGKGVTAEGDVAGVTSCVVWGSEGTNAQHAYFQQLHQGPDTTPVDFVGVLDDGEGRAEHSRALLANMAAQSEALLRGLSLAEAERKGLDEGLDADDARRLAPHRVCPGGRGSSVIVLPDLKPERLGALIALYEHKTFVNSVFWGINPFDQWGVELGKVLAVGALATLAGGDASAHDPSTQALLARIRSVMNA